jgi:hypothetical protein
MLGGTAAVDDLGITLREEAAQSESGLRIALATLRAEGRPSAEDARAAVARMSGAGRVSKFQPCLPPAMLGDLLVERLFDVETARAVVASG